MNFKIGSLLMTAIVANCHPLWAGQVSTVAKAPTVIDFGTARQKIEATNLRLETGKSRIQNSNDKIKSAEGASGVASCSKIKDAIDLISSNSKTLFGLRQNFYSRLIDLCEHRPCTTAYPKCRNEAYKISQASDSYSTKGISYSNYSEAISNIQDLKNKNNTRKANLDFYEKTVWYQLGQINNYPDRCKKIKNEYASKLTERKAAIPWAFNGAFGDIKTNLKSFFENSSQCSEANITDSELADTTPAED